MSEVEKHEKMASVSGGRKRADTGNVISTLTFGVLPVSCKRRAPGIAENELAEVFAEESLTEAPIKFKFKH